jgi:hypothetical protein
MILSLFWLVIFAGVVVATFFKLVAEHLVAFFDLPLTCRTAFTFIVSPFFAGGFPPFELPCHIAVVVTFYILAR